MPANLPYPFQFDPSQWKNPYTKWAGQALPFMSAEIGPSGLYGGTAPTDAMGNPIQSYTDANNAAQATYQQQMADYQKQLDAYNAGGGAPSTPGTTINSPPAQAGSAMTPQMAQSMGAPGLALAGAGGPPGVTPQTPYGAPGTNPLATAAAGGATPQQLGQMFSQMSPTIPSYTDTGQRGGQAVMGPGTTPNPNYQRVMGQLFANSFGGAAPARPAAPTPPSQPNMTGAYLAALQNPGPVISPGANVPQAPPPSQQSNVLQQFLANWQGAGGKTTGAGNYNNKGFFDALAGNV